MSFWGFADSHPVAGVALALVGMLAVATAAVQIREAIVSTVAALSRRGGGAP